MITHEQLKEKCLKAMGGKPPMAARSTWGKFLQIKGTSFFMNYDWIKVKAFYSWLHTDHEFEWLDHEHGITLLIEK